MRPVTELADFGTAIPLAKAEKRRYIGDKWATRHQQPAPSDGYNKPL